MGSFHNNIRLMLEFLKFPFLDPHFSDCVFPPDDVISDIAIYADNTTPYSMCDQASDLWQQLGLVSELESDQQDNVDWSRKWLVDFNAEKTQLVNLTSLRTLMLLMWKWVGLFLRENHLLRCWR